VIRPVYWYDDTVVMIDQKALPARESLVVCHDYTDVAAAIRDMTVRGAPAIGIAAAMGVALGFLKHGGESPGNEEITLERIREELASTRPTAVNLFWALERMNNCFKECRNDGFEAIAKNLINEAQRILEEDIDTNRRMGRVGCNLVPPGGAVLTHCNAGALATGGYGTALGVIRAAHEAGRHPRVFADETRPLLQGARLTAWEMVREGIPVTVITDSMAGYFMARGDIDLVIVGADRIAANGDTANKIGTYTLALLARAHGIPFYVAAPRSTIDVDTASGVNIPIEERNPDEVLRVAGIETAARGAAARNPSFDVTPAELISAIITENGLVEPPLDCGIGGLFAAHTKSGETE
jgi:methylthioribose-1-phosphate isomerase